MFERFTDRARRVVVLAQEEARAKQAKLNWDDIGYEEEPSPLVLRVPQLKEAHAVVTSARKRMCGSSPDWIAHSTEYPSSSDCHAKRRLQSAFCANEKL